jgi:sugar lactone lactonase YvrE
MSRPYNTLEKMMATKISLAAFATSAALLAGATLAHAEAPQKLWEVAVPGGPESALPDTKAGVIYLSVGNEDPTAKDGNGAIALLSLDGKMTNPKWATGLNAPKGLVISKGHLFIGDVDELVEVDLKDGKVLAKHAAPGGKLLNDTAADADGNIYVSDALTNRIYRLSNGKLEVWVKDDRLAGPNGTHVEGDNLIVNTWGVLTGEGFNTSVAGHLFSISLKDKSIKDLGDGKPIGNLDGLWPLGGGAYLLTDFMAGKLLKFNADGKVDELLALTKTTADIGYDPASKTVYIPNMGGSILAAYRLP